MTNQEIKALALKHGFTEQQQADGGTDLNLYVYAFANALVEAVELRTIAAHGRRLAEKWRKHHPDYRAKHNTPCPRCQDGILKWDDNSYHDFLRCEKCNAVPMMMNGEWV